MTTDIIYFLTILGCVLAAFIFIWREMSLRFDKVDAEMRSRGTEINSRFDKVDARFDKVDARLDKVEGIVTGLNTRMALVESKVTDLNTNINYLMWQSQHIPPSSHDPREGSSSQ